MKNICKILILLFLTCIVNIGKAQKQKVYDKADEITVSGIKIKLDKKKLKTKEAQQAWARYESSFQKRGDIIPELIATIKSRHPLEPEIMENLLRLREEVILLKPDKLIPEKIGEYLKAQDRLT